MSPIASADTPYDTDEIVALRQEIRAHHDAHREQLLLSRRRDLELRARYGELMLAQRPAYPTPEHIEGLARIATWVHDDVAYGNHLGYPTEVDKAAGRALPKGVRFSSAMRRINVYALSPYGYAATHRVWNFTGEEVEAMRALIREHGLRIMSDWAHGDGHAFTVASKQV
ncbi:hypothetical protein GCG21_08745 [Pseudactinotalea sp. HY160]|uniref:hypothetical protein n=1 Tax=Pseudactinotalea sp. HY160 TaxID=2654490 RepID=UPI00128BDCE2|nr:hypothetical protein [Pseudactinotalea sp. HY160]MPV50092.1 hypothetical protein [Pseudactinotalea sp. HY160]